MTFRLLAAAATLFAVSAVWTAAPVFAQSGGGDDNGSGSGGDDGGSGGDDGGSGNGGGSGVGSGSGSGSGSDSGSGSGAPGEGDGSFGSRDGSERFMRDNRSATDFVGADSEDNTSIRGEEDAAGANNQGLGGFFNQLFGQGGLGGTQQQQRNQPSSGGVRVRLTPAIEFFGANGADLHAVRMEAKHAAVIPRYSHNPHVTSVAGVSMVVEDRVAILTGTVDSERQKELIGGLLELEPGISSVDNRLVVRPVVTNAAAGFVPTTAANASAN